MHPGWKNQRADVPPHRNTGLRGEGAGDVHDETERRTEEQAAAVTQAAPAAAAATPSAGGSGPVIQPPAPPPPPVLPDRFHKWGHYVLIAKDHRVGDDPVIPPGYRSPSATVSTIADGYAKAKSIASQDGTPCPLLIVGGGGPWIENIVLDQAGVDLEGWGNPVIQGNLTHLPQVNDIVVKQIGFTTTNGGAAYNMPQGPYTFPTSPGSGIRFIDCDFSGPRLAFQAQRTFFADRCRFWHTRPTTYTDRLAPCWIEQEDIQSWFTFFRDCSFYTYLRFNPTSPAGAPTAPGAQLVAPGFAIRATARRNGVAPPMPNMYSFDGIYRAGVNPLTGFGAVRSGLILDDCAVQGSLDCDSWFVSHRGGWQYGGVPSAPDSGLVYAHLRGYDWMEEGTNFIGRQFGIVMFDLTQTHSSMIAQAFPAPDLVTAVYPGGTAVHYRHSLNPVRTEGYGGRASQNFGSVMDFYQVESSTGASGWRGGTIAGTDVGGHVGVVAQSIYHPLYGE